MTLGGLRSVDTVSSLPSPYHFAYQHGILRLAMSLVVSDQSLSYLYATALDDHELSTDADRGDKRPETTGIHEKTEEVLLSGEWGSLPWRASVAARGGGKDSGIPKGRATPSRPCIPHQQAISRALLPCGYCFSATPLMLESEFCLVKKILFPETIT